MRWAVYDDKNVPRALVVVDIQNKIVGITISEFSLIWRIYFTLKFLWNEGLKISSNRIEQIYDVNDGTGNKEEYTDYWREKL